MAEALQSDAALEIAWCDGEPVRVLSAGAPVSELAMHFRDGAVRWFVLWDDDLEGGRAFALAAEEVEALLRAFAAAERFSDDEQQGSLGWRPLREMLRLVPDGASTLVSLPRPLRAEPLGQRGVAAGRVVVSPAASDPADWSVGILSGVGTRSDPVAARDLLTYAARFQEGEEADVEYVDLLEDDEDFLGPTLGGWGAQAASPESAPFDPDAPPEPTATEAPIPVVISGTAPGSAAVGDLVTVRYRIERDGPEAQPYDERFRTEVAPDQPLRLVLVTKGDGLALAGERVQDVDPPRAGRPVEGTFSLVAVHAEAAAVSVMVFQGGSHLGSLAFTVAITTTATVTEPVRARTEAAPRHPGDDDVLIWTIVEGRDEHGNRRYEHHLAGVQLGQYLHFSKSIQDSGSGYAALRAEYLERTYERVLYPVRSQADLPALAIRVRTAGTSLCRMLIDPDVTRRLWEWRDRIRTIRVHSYDPLIPWELVRLQHPETNELDDRYLAEYGLVRWLPDLDPAPPDLRLDRWRYLAATYPNGSAVSVTGEVGYFTNDLPREGIHPRPIEATLPGVLRALEEDDADVLHLACHGEANLKQIESARLLIGDRRGPGGEVEPEVIEASDVRASARFTSRPGPVAFLSACEGGRAAPSLTDWEGWPHAFLKSGASVFVGTSWSVRSKPAYAFSRAFYDALLAGETLAEAATRGRSAAKQLGDASWLAYKVYGNPLARREGS